MQHCPSCKVDFADDFESCFQCGETLVPGGIEASAGQAQQREAEAVEEEDRRASRRMLALARSLGLALVAVLVLVGLFVVITDDSIPLQKTWTLVHSDADGKPLLEGSHCVRTEARRKELAELSGLVLPPLEEGKTMIVYYPVDSKVVFRRFMPTIVSAHRDGKGIVVHVCPSEKETPASLRLFEGVGRSMLKGLGPRAATKMPRYQVVAVARLASSNETLRFAVPRSLGGTEQEATLQELSKSFVRDIALGAFGSFFGYVIGGGLALFAFFWVLVKFS